MDSRQGASAKAAASGAGRMQEAELCEVIVRVAPLVLVRKARETGVREGVGTDIPFEWGGAPRTDPPLTVKAAQRITVPSSARTGRLRCRLTSNVS